MKKITIFIALLSLLATAGCNRGAEDVQGTSRPGAGGATASPGEHGDHNTDDRQRGRDDDEEKVEINGEQANHHDEADVGTLSNVEVEADDYYFEPTILRGKPNQQITIRVRNEGENEHNFSLDEQAINRDLDIGRTNDIVVSFPASGTLTFYCKLHRGQGMLGGLQAG